MRYACRWCRIRARQIIVATGSDARPDLKTHLVGRGKIGRQFSDRTRKELVDSLTRSGVILGEPSQDSALEIRATGFRYSGLAERSQLGTDARGRVVLDENLQAVPGIWGGRGLGGGSGSAISSRRVRGRYTHGCSCR